MADFDAFGHQSITPTGCAILRCCSWDHHSYGPQTSEQPTATTSQQQALQSAQSYLSMGGFSRAGLIGQLSSSAGEGFSVADATWAADHAGANWNQQAVKSAQSYLRMGGFSRQGLLDQLTSSAGEKFTQGQAEYVVQVYR